jgi:predicted nucleotidyltransferase
MNTNLELKKRLPSRFIDELLRLGEKYQKKGAQLFVFGSFATASNRQTSDLDLGVLWKGKRKNHIFTSLYSEIQALPTIRKIDLVDMEQVDNDFKKKVLESGIIFLNEESVKT